MDVWTGLTRPAPACASRGRATPSARPSESAASVTLDTPPRSTAAPRRPRRIESVAEPMHPAPPHSPLREAQPKRLIKQEKTLRASVRPRFFSGFWLNRVGKKHGRVYQRKWGGQR